jgi:hypothetical protein
MVAWVAGACFQFGNFAGFDPIPTIASYWVDLACALKDQSEELDDDDGWMTRLNGDRGISTRRSVAS